MPDARAYRARAGAAAVSFRFDALRNELHYVVTIPASALRGSLAVVLRRIDAARVGGAEPRVRVVHRLVGAGAASGSGVIPLGELDRRALGEGRLGILHVTTEAPLGRAAAVELLVR